jgi:hypothetical protein
MKYSTVLAFAASATASVYYDPAYDVVSSSSTPAKPVIPSSSVVPYYDYPVVSTSSVKSSSTPYSPVKPSTSSAEVYYDYPVSSSTPAAPVKPYTTKWVVTAYPSPCPYETTVVSGTKTYTKTYTSTSTITTSSCITYYPSSSIKSSSTPYKPVKPSTSSVEVYYEYPVSSSTPAAPVKPYTPAAPVKPSTPAAPVYPVVYGTATSAYNYAATGTGSYVSPAKFTGAASKNGAGIAIAGAAIVAALF